MIKTVSLTKTFGPTPALENLSTTIESGSIYGLVGSNGAGKSTLLHLLAGIYRPTSGSIAEMVVRGNPIQIQQKLSVFHPLLCETVPLTLEEIFITEMEAVGYDYNNVIF